jgi:hypothetical protein
VESMLVVVNGAGQDDDKTLAAHASPCGQIGETSALCYSTCIMKVYLSGPISGSSDGAIVGWRQRAGQIGASVTPALPRRGALFSVLPKCLI